MVALLAHALAITLVIHAPCPVGTEPACAYRANVVYVADDWARRDPQMFPHEMGHIVDYNFTTNSDRGTFEAIMQMNRPWDAIDGNAPKEQYAEAFALCARSIRWPPRRGGSYRYSPTVAQHRKVCRLFAAIGQRR